MRWLIALLVSIALCGAQSTPPSITIDEYNPKSSLVVPQNPRTRAKFAFVDVHNHQRFPMTPEGYQKLLADMDALNLRVMVNLSGGFGERLKTAVDSSRAAAPGRFVIFANLDFSDIDNPAYGQRTAAQLERDVNNGAAGLKLFKNFGMDLKDTKGARIHVDDPRFDLVFQTCARLKIAVLIHTADPHQFWLPVDKFNERWLELNEMPGRRRPLEKNASWDTLIHEQHSLFRRHPKTTFINAHLGWLGGDLARLGKLMDECQNMNVEIGAVLAELGRQPRAARAFFVKYQDRIFMGKDSWNPAEYHTYFRVLETGDEYFDYYRKRHAFWKMYGLDLPEDVLKKLYYKNALRLIPGIDFKAFTK